MRTLFMYLFIYPFIHVLSEGFRTVLFSWSFM